MGGVGGKRARGRCLTQQIDGRGRIATLAWRDGERHRAALPIDQRMQFGGTPTPASGLCPAHEPPGPPAAQGCALGVGAVQHELGRRTTGCCQLGERLALHPLARPADPTVVERLARAVGARRIHPAPTADQHLHDAEIIHWSSTRGTPRGLLGRNGRSRAICALSASM